MIYKNHCYYYKNKLLSTSKVICFYIEEYKLNCYLNDTLKVKNQNIKIIFSFRISSVKRHFFKRKIRSFFNNLLSKKMIIVLKFNNLDSVLFFLSKEFDTIISTIKEYVK